MLTMWICRLSEKKVFIELLLSALSSLFSNVALINYKMTLFFQKNIWQLQRLSLFCGSFRNLIKKKKILKIALLRFLKLKNELS